jgi:hypothetical protein
MNILKLIKKIKEAQELYSKSVEEPDEIWWNKYNEAVKKLNEVIKELEQQIDDGK